MTSPLEPAHRGRDLDSPEEITELVRRFYQDVAQDDLLGPMFNDVARVDWSVHLPKLEAFWCRILLGIPGFAGNAYTAHREVDEQRPFTAEMFERWLDLFHEHVDFGWTGPNAETAKAFARRVAYAHSTQIVGATVDYVPTGTPVVPAPPAPVPGGGRDGATAPDDRPRIPVTGVPRDA